LSAAPPAAGEARAGKAVALLLWLLGLAACVVVITRTPFSADLSAFLPSKPTPAQQILVEQLRDGVVSRLLLVAIENDQPAQLAASSKKLAAQLRKDARFVAVNNGEEPGLTKDRELIWQNRYLLSPGMDEPDHFSPKALREALDDDVQMLGSPAGALLRKVLPNDPTGELVRLIDTFEGQSRPMNQDGVWFSRDGKRALLMLQTKAAGFDIDAQELAIADIRAAFDTIKSGQTGAGAQKLIVTGPGVFAAATRESIKHDASHLSMIATVLVALLMFALYRSPRVLLLGFVPVASGALAGIAAVSLLHGSVHGITLGFGVTLIGEGVDYAIYLFTQIAPGTTPKQTLKRLWPTLRLGVLTSICGFSALLFSGFPGLAQLGLFSIVGLIVAAAVTRFVLPVLLPAGFAARSVDHLAPALLRSLAYATKLRWPFFILSAGALAWLIAIGGPPFSDELASLSPVPKREQQLDEALRRDLGAPDVRYLIVASSADAQGALTAAERLAAPLQTLADAGALQGFDSPARVLPSTGVQRKRQASLPAPEVLKANLAQAQQGTPFNPGVFDPFLVDVEAARKGPLLTRESLQGSALALKLDSLLIRRAAVTDKSAGWAALLPLRGVEKPEEIAKALAAAPEAKAVLLDIKRDADTMFSSYRREAQSHTLLGAAAIAVLLFISLRRPRRVFDVMAPLAAAVLVTTCILVLLGFKLTIFHLVGLSLVVAVGSNYSLFFEQQASTGQDRERTIVSLLFANVAMVIAFGLLGTSSVPVLAAIGLTVAIGAVLSLLFSAILARKTP
jgi:predicted exporter